MRSIFFAMTELEGNKVKGYVCGCLSAICYGVNPLFSLPVMSRGVGVDSILFYRYAMAAVALAILMLVKKIDFRLKAKELIAVVIMGTLFCSSSIFLFESYRMMPAGIASTILFVYPVLTAIIMAVFFKEKIRWFTVVSLALSFGGLMLLYKGDESGSVTLMGIFFVVMSSLTYAIYIVGVNRSALKEMNSVKLSFYAIVVGTFVLFFFRLGCGTQLQVVPDGFSWLCLAGLGIVPTTISLIALAVSIRNIGSTPAAILGVLEPATAVFFGCIVFGEPFTISLVFGFITIMVAVLLIILAPKYFGKKG